MLVEMSELNEPYAITVSLVDCIRISASPKKRPISFRQSL